MSGGLEKLNFEVILDHSKFDKEIKSVKKLAKELNTTVSNALNLKMKISTADAKALANAEKLVRAQREITSETQKTAEEKTKTVDKEKKIAASAEKTQKSTAKTSASVNGLNMGLTKTSSIMTSLAHLTGVTFGAIGIRRFLSSLIDVTGQFEVQRMALRNMLQDVDAAEKIYEDLYRFSSESTYRFSELARYAKQLAAFNIEKGSLLETTKMLGDVASGVGVSMDRIILAYGHVKSSGFLRGIQLRSFAQNGVPVLEELAKQFSEIEQRTVSLGEIFDKMMRREIPFEMVEEAFKRMTTEGGKFYQMQEVLAKTLAGQINILKGRWENMLAAVGEANSGVLKDTVSYVSNLIANYENLGKKIAEIIAVYGAYKATVFLVTAASEGLFAATFNLQLAIERLNARLVANPYAAIALTITALGATLYKLGTSVHHVYTDIDNIQASLTEGTEKYRSTLEAEKVELDRLYERLRLAKKGTEEYASAKKALETRFNPYIEELRAEGVEVNDLANIYENLATKIENANKQRFLESVTETATSRFKAATDAIEKDFKETMKIVGKGLSTEEQYDLWNYIMGGDLYSGDVNRFNKLSSIVGQGEYRGAYSGPSYSHWYSVDELRGQYARVKNAFKETMNDADELFKKESDGLIETTANAANQTRYNIGSIVIGIQNYDKQISALRNKAKTEGLLIDENAGINEKQLLDNAVAGRKELTDLYKDIMGVDYDKDTHNAETAAERTRRERIKDIKTEISLLEKYLSIYNKLKVGDDDSAATSYLEKKFGSREGGYSNLEGDILKLTGSLRELGEEGEQAADSIEASLGIDEVSRMVKQTNDEAKAREKAAKALENYNKALAKLRATSPEISGSGFYFDAAKILAAHQKEMGDIESSYTDAENKLQLAHSGNAEVIKRETDALIELREQRKKFATDKAQDGLNNLAKSYLEDEYFFRGIDITNLSGKSLPQIRALKKELNDIANTALKITNDKDIDTLWRVFGFKVGEDDVSTLNLDEVGASISEDTYKILKLQQGVKEAGLSFDNLGAAIQRALDKGLERLSEEERKGLVALIKKATKEVGKLASAWANFAEASGDKSLAETISGLSEMNDLLSEAYTIFESLGGMAAGGFSAMGGWLSIVLGLNIKSLELAAAAEEAANRQAEAVMKLRSTIRMSQDTPESFFGVSDMDYIVEYANKAKEISNKIDGYRDEIGNFSITTKHYGFWEKALGWMNNENWRNGELLPDIRENLLEMYGEDLFDQYGNLDANILREILNTYTDLSEEEKNWINRAIQDSEDYAEAVDKVAAKLKDVFGDIAQDAASAIVDSWTQAGDAALDYAEILDDVARSYAQMVVKSAIIDKILTPQRAQEIANMLVGGDVEGVMNAISSDLEDIAGIDWTVLRDAFLPFFKTEDTEGDQSLGAGIKSITEETASLLASYVNAIRADVSVMRSIQERGIVSLEVLGGIAPNLADYMNRTAAYQFDIMQSNREILSRLDSVIGLPGSVGSVVRVEVD